MDRKKKIILILVGVFAAAALYLNFCTDFVNDTTPVNTEQIGPK